LRYQLDEDVKDFDQDVSVLSLVLEFIPREA